MYVNNQATSEPPIHVAIIMDGNGRWASARNLPRTAGHKAGAEAVRRVVEAAPKVGVGTLTLYAFSCENWKRPFEEVSTLMHLFLHNLRKETPKLCENGVRLNIIGRRDRFSDKLLAAIEQSEAATANGKTLNLRVAVDYSSRDSIIAAARLLPKDGPVDHATFARTLAQANHAYEAPDVDLLIRTGGEQRLSNFLLWECSYAELYFTRRMWPDFDKRDLELAIATFRKRERRFGGLPGHSEPALVGNGQGMARK
jgi:undecaprenyl diphosphate synthase